MTSGSGRFRKCKVIVLLCYWQVDIYLSKYFSLSCNAQALECLEGWVETVKPLSASNQPSRHSALSNWRHRGHLLACEVHFINGHFLDPIPSSLLKIWRMVGWLSDSLLLLSSGLVSPVHTIHLEKRCPVRMKSFALLVAPYSTWNFSVRDQNIARERNCPDVKILNPLFGLCLFVFVYFHLLVFLCFCLFVFFHLFFLSFWSYCLFVLFVFFDFLFFCLFVFLSFCLDIMLIKCLKCLKSQKSLFVSKF